MTDRRFSARAVAGALVLVLTGAGCAGPGLEPPFGEDDGRYTPRATNTSTPMSSPTVDVQGQAPGAGDGTTASESDGPDLGGRLDGGIVIDLDAAVPIQPPTEDVDGAAFDDEDDAGE